MEHFQNKENSLGIRLCILDIPQVQYIEYCVRICLKNELYVVCYFCNQVFI